MDADITAASTALELQKIQAQDRRDAHKAMLALLKSEFDALPSTAVEFRREMAVAIAAKYFTTGTATTPESVLLDAQNDARRFAAALDEAVKAVG